MLLSCFVHFHCTSTNILGLLLLSVHVTIPVASGGYLQKGLYYFIMKVFGAKLKHCLQIIHRNMYTYVFRMVRCYKRKTERGSYGLENIKKAVDDVWSGKISKRKAELTYGIPRRTLGRHLANSVRKPGNLGRFEVALGKEVENALSCHIISMQQMMFGFSTKDIRKLAYEMAKASGKLSQFKSDTQEVGVEWLKGFMQRHPELSLRIPEPTSMSRAVAFNKANVDKFFRIYQEELQKEQHSAERIWNVDETGFTAVHKPGKILAKSGAKQVGKITSGEKGVTTTAVCAVNAMGQYIPPMLIYKRKRMNDILLKGAPPGTIGGCSDNGWITTELFLKWMKHFAHHAKPSEEKPILLLLDGHSSHKSLSSEHN